MSSSRAISVSRQAVWANCILAAYRCRRARSFALLAVEANRAKERARRHLYAAKMQLAQTAWRDTEIARLLDILKEQLPQEDEEDLRGFEWHYFWKLCHRERLTITGPANRTSNIAFSPDGRRLASGHFDGKVKVWDAQAGTELLVFAAHAQPVRGVAFSPDGR